MRESREFSKCGTELQRLIRVVVSQKLSAVCSAALSVLDDNLLTRLKLLLSDQSPLTDNLVQEAALKSIAILVRK